MDPPPGRGADEHRRRLGRLVPQRPRRFIAARLPQPAVIPAKAGIQGSGGLIVNPYDIKGTADAIHRGIAMGHRERARRWTPSWTRCGRTPPPPGPTRSSATSPIRSRPATTARRHTREGGYPGVWRADRQPVRHQGHGGRHPPRDSHGTPRTRAPVDPSPGRGADEHGRCLGRLVPQRPRRFIAARLPQPAVIPAKAGIQGSGGLIVNPYDIKGTADAIHRGIAMGHRERARRWTPLLDEVRTNTAAAWADSFLSDLADS